MMHLAGNCKTWICDYACEKNLISLYVLMSILSAQEARGHLVWSFAYQKEWLDTQS